MVRCPTPEVAALHLHPTPAALADVVAAAVPRRRPGVGLPLSLVAEDRTMLAVGRTAPVPLGPAVGLVVMAAAVLTALEADLLGRSTTVGECLHPAAMPSTIDPGWTVDVLLAAVPGTMVAAQRSGPDADDLAVALAAMLTASMVRDLAGAVTGLLAGLPALSLATTTDGRLRWRLGVGGLVALAWEPGWETLAAAGTLGTHGSAAALRLGVQDGDAGAGVWAYPAHGLVLAGCALGAPLHALDEALGGW